METIDEERLRYAFDAFNERSSVLETSYRALQTQVESLTRELKLAERARRSERAEKKRLADRLSNTLDALPGAIVVLDGDGVVTETNGRAVELLHEPLAGCAWSEIVRREFCETGLVDGDLCLSDGRWLNLSRQPLGAESGEVLLLADVSESRRTAELLQRRERLSSIGEMTARLAHQLRTPLASALLYTGQLGGSPDSRSKAAAKIRARLGELSRMVDDMLCYAGGARRGGETFAVCDLYGSIVDAIGLEAGAAAIESQLRDPDLAVDGNRDAIKGALLNLIDNARQAAGAGARVVLGAERVGASVCLTVSDNGPGIPAPIAERIFEPFFTTRPQGTGLGLAVVRAVAEAHDGEVIVDSGPGGTTVALCLPQSGLPQSGLPRSGLPRQHSPRSGAAR